MKILFCLSLFGLATADISLQIITDNNCGADGGEILQDIHANLGNQFDSTECIATGQYNSVNLVSVDPGFQCNLYGDAACANFLRTVNTVGCEPIIGLGTICFDQSLFTNPFAQSTAVISVGTQPINLFGGDLFDAVVKSSVQHSCSDTGCDNTNPLVLTTNIPPSNPACHEGLDQIDPSACATEDCTTTVTLTGNFDNSNERDYMESLLQNVAAGIVSNPVSFLQVEMKSPSSAVQAGLTLDFVSQCNSVSPPSSFDCSSAISDVGSAALALIPDVGGVIATIFQVACDSNSS
ncbi:hypothetical protein AYL99_09865 [Fonsecaea erecta]|uniref:Uncharacterized protein n=1 Tax=Fonsecaea erecta TaxID=1367422 RepID=A0A178Z958_9EURO|nr:hypothetical protein AYL99_09865 [Fonsecaea erecta]OAP55713.1 hypothetical protein AYL99_09865 [Fonsecaea erecta]